MMAPPGTPGAATIAIPIMQMKPMNIPGSIALPCISISATAQQTILRQLPDMWMVAQSGMVNPAISSLTPIFTV